MGGGHAEDISHGLSVLRLAWNWNPVGRDADDIGSLECAESEAFRKPAVVTDKGADATKRRPKHGESEIATFEEEVLLIPEVHLAECAHVARWADHNCSIVKGLSVTLVDPGDTTCSTRAKRPSHLQRR